MLEAMVLKETFSQKDCVLATRRFLGRFPARADWFFDNGQSLGPDNLFHDAQGRPCQLLALALTPPLFLSQAGIVCHDDGQRFVLISVNFLGSVYLQRKPFRN